MAKHLRFVLGALALLASTVHGSPPLGTPTCSAQAWVRAPDLIPNAIVQGDARVKITAECPDVDNILLGLRFKERSFVKALRSREDAKQLHPEPPVTDDFSDISPLAAVPSFFANRSVQDTYEEVLTNKDLWIIREEERVVFETTHPINVWNGNHGILRDTIQNFTILVPSTNFPSALDNFNTIVSYSGDNEVVDAEWMYEYFAQVSFADGTTREISAGLTAFQPLHDPAYTSGELASATVELQNVFGNTMTHPSTTNYSIEVRAISGLIFSAGTKSHPITAVITRTGPPRTFSVPLNISVCVMPKMSFEWATEYGVSDTDSNAAFAHVSLFKLRATSDGRKQPFRVWDSCQTSHKVAVIMSNSTSDEAEENVTVTTTSAPVTLFVDVDDDHIPSFEGYYQTLANSLVITLETPRTEDEPVDPDDPLSEPEFEGWVSLFEDDEEAWVPWEKKTNVWHINTWKSYTGRVPVVVHLSTEGMLFQDCPDARTDTSEQVISSNGEGCNQPSLTHYLAKDARGPVFVDSNAIPDLISEDLAERQLRAPILEPVVSSPPKGEEAVHRYYCRHTNRPLIYVGETWAKRVAQKDEVGGVVAGSIAARVHSAMYDSFVPAGTLFSWFQSFGAIL